MAIGIKKGYTCICTYIYIYIECGAPVTRGEGLGDLCCKLG